jgi:hypothetical protein
VHPNTKQASLVFARWLAAHGMRFGSDADPRPLFGLKRSPSAPSEWVLSSASRPIPAGTVIARLPLGLTLSPDSPLRNPLAAHAVVDASDKPLTQAPLSVHELEAGSELRGMIDRIPASLWPLKGGLRLLFEFALHSGSRGAGGNTGAMPGSEVRSSFYAPYINLLPNSFDSIPLFWTPAQVDALQYQPLATQLRLRSSFLRNKSAELATHVNVFGSAAPALTTPERLAWAMSCVSSRAFQLQADASHCTNLPLIDMANHSYENNCKVAFDAGADGRAATPPPPNASMEELLRYWQQPVRLESVRDIPPNTELTLNYGWHSNEHFLLHYGFLLDENPADVLEIRRDAGALDVAADMAGEKGVESWDQASTWKRVIAQQQGLTAVSTGDNAASFRITRDQLDPHLIALVHVMLAPSAEQPAEQRGFDFFLRQAAPKQQPLTADTDATAQAMKEAPAALSPQQWVPQSQDLSQQPPSVLRVLYAYLSLVQSSFPTTLQQDVDALANVVQTILTPTGDAAGADAGSKQRQLEEAVQREELAIRFRIGKKRILAEHMRRLQKIIGTNA